MFTDGGEADCGLVCDLMHLEGAENLASYGKDFYAGMPAVTKNKFGNGAVYYVGTRLEEAGLCRVLTKIAEQAGVTPVIAEETELEVVCRETEDTKFYFVINFKDEQCRIPQCFVGEADLLTDKVIENGEMIPKYGVRLVSVKK